MKKVLSFLLALALCAGLSIQALAAGFSDVPPGHYAASAISECVAKGVVSGFSDGTFRPAAPVTRAQFCVMIARAFFPDDLKRSETAENKARSWFTPAVNALYYSGPYGGVITSTSFIPNEEYPVDSAMGQPISRYDMAHIAANTMLYNGLSVEVSQFELPNGIADRSSIPALHESDVALCYNLGVIGGLSDGTFGGDKTVTRAQSCAIIQRIAQRLAGKTPSQPSQSSQPAQPSQPAADPSKFPEARCMICGYLMRAAGSTTLDLNNGGSSTGHFIPCDLCNNALICQQCSDHYADAALYMRRHEAVCASGGTLAPMEDFYSPSYRGSLYYQQLKNVTLTGNYRQDILAVAASQIGYRGSSSPNQLDGSRGGGSCTEYNWIFSEDAEGAWCSEFASWCARQAGVPTDILHCSLGACPDDFGGTAYSWQDTVFTGGYYMPQPGDLMLICHSSRSVSTSDDMDHTTIVESVDWTGDTVRITVIDGNSNNSVRRHDYTYNASRGMTGYFVAPDYP